jgi:hypothetical protein
VIGRYAAAGLLVPASALAVGLLSAPSAAADCTMANGVSVCAQGTVRGPDGGTGPGPTTGPYVPYPCDYDYLCDAGLSIDLSPWDRPNRPDNGGGGGRFPGRN